MRLNDEFMGQAIVPLTFFTDQVPHTDWYPLRDETATNEEHMGEVRVQIEFVYSSTAYHARVIAQLEEKKQVLEQQEQQAKDVMSDLLVRSVDPLIR